LPIGYNDDVMTAVDSSADAHRRLILAFTEDLFLQPRLQDTAHRLGFDLQIIESAQVFGSDDSPSGERMALTEPLSGPDSALIRWLSATHPALLLFDTTARNLPWRRWIQVLKTSAASRRLPVIAFGPHVNESDLASARAAGADEVFTRGQFQAKLADILQDWAEPPIAGQLQKACRGRVSQLASHGIKLHNQGDYFEAHEELEHAWMEADEHEGYLYRALLQVSVAHLHLERGNAAGAAKLLMRVHRWLDPLPDSCRGLDLARLRRAVEQLRSALYQSLDSGDAVGAEFQPIKFHRSSSGLDALAGGAK
jgi:CheY-like chemotaxis protein